MARAYPTDGQLNFLHYVEFHHWNSLDDSTRKILKAVINGGGYAWCEPNYNSGRGGLRQSTLNKLRDRYLDIYILSRK